MLPQIKHNLTNWVDGMKIHRLHFIDSENAFVDAVRDVRATVATTYSFGLLPPGSGDKKSLDLKILKAQSDHFKISLSICRAITVGGARIEIMVQQDQELLCEDRLDYSVNAGIGNNKPEAFLAIITVDPFYRVPSGEPTAETPPRNPYCVPKYALHVVSEDSMNQQDLGTYHLPVARFISKNDELIVDPAYIPPCASIKAHATMIHLYNSLGALFNHIQDYGTLIVQKVVNKGQNAPLAQNVKKLCVRSVEFISSMFFSYRNILPQQAPVFVAESVVKLANYLKLELDFMPEKEKEEMLLYFKEWNDISPAAFEELLANCIELEYNHYQIQESFVPLIQFATKWKELLEKLNELELIGRRKEKDIFVGKVYQEKKKGFSLLD
jgi:hypothetical protein